MKSALRFILTVLLLAVEAGSGSFDASRFQSFEWRLTPGGASRQEARCALRAMPTKGHALVVEALVDPVADAAGNLQVEAGVCIGLQKGGGVDPRGPKPPRVAVLLRDNGESGSWSLWLDGKNVTAEPPDRGNCDNGALQQPFVFAMMAGPVRVRLVVAPESGRTLVRLYVDDLFRPVEEHRVEGDIASPGCALMAAIGGSGKPAVTRVEDFSASVVPVSNVLASARPAEAAMAALDPSHPALRGVKRLLQAGRRPEAEAQFLRHMRSRREPVGPGLSGPLLYGNNWKEIADEALRGRYGTMGFFAGFSDRFVDANGAIRWESDNGFLNRHFHWCSLAKAFQETGDARYARRFAFEVKDWVTREPFYQPKSPHVSGVDLMDGTVFKLGWMNTSNIGRRCELTWWPAYEVFRKAAEFDDESHFAMLLGFIRQSRLLANPTSFAWWDDGGAHGTLALLQNALMLPELAESAHWRRIGEKRLAEVVARQFYPDGAHVSLSTGYNFASIKALENGMELFGRCGIEPPESLRQRLHQAYRHPMLIARPVNRGMVDLNDGGWSAVDDHLQTGARLFPDDAALRWFATSAREGSPPTERSLLFPWAGHAILRTGWGPKDVYLFMDAGPIGMSHAKEDKLTVFVDRGGALLLGSGGRAGYSDAEGMRYTGSIYAQNTLVVDDMNHARIPARYEHEISAPEERRFATSDGFDFCEGFHTHGWYSAQANVKGRHARQVVLVKGSRPPETAFFLVLDEIRFEDDREHIVEALWHPARDETALTDGNLTAESWDAGGAIRIQPLLRDGLDARIVAGQTEPHLQGWLIAGQHKKTMPCVVHRWAARGATRRAWLLVPGGSRAEWPVANATTEGGDSHRKIRIHRAGGGVCEVIWRTTDLRMTEIDVAGKRTATLEMTVEPTVP